jgi:hypothetical protein
MSLVGGLSGPPTKQVARAVGMGPLVLAAVPFVPVDGIGRWGELAACRIPSCQLRYLS